MHYNSMHYNKNDDDDDDDDEDDDDDDDEDGDNDNDTDIINNNIIMELQKIILLSTLHIPMKVLSMQ